MGVSRRLAMLAPLALAACGWEPALAPGGAGAALRGRVAYTTPETFDGYLLLTELEERLGRPAAAVWGLSVTLELSEEAAAATQDGVSSRANLTGRASWRLTRLANGAEVDAGAVQGFAGHGSSGGAVATHAAAANARRRLAAMLAEQITARLLAMTPEDYDAAEGP